MARARTTTRKPPAAPDEQEVIDGDAMEVEAEIRHLPEVRAAEAVVARGEISVEELVAQADKIKAVMGRAMKDGVHYGLIPGITKPTLLKPGAEMLNVLLRLAPSYRSEKVFGDGGHLTVIASCTLTHIPTGLVIAQGEGLCTTRESKYAYRKGGRTCPTCGAVGTINKSKFAPRSGDYQGAKPSDPPGWYCFAKTGGCGQNFAASDPEIANQPDIARVDNPDLPDTWNTVLKMADKRALVAAVLNGTGASDVFTQDVEDAGAVAADKTEVEQQEFQPDTDLLPNAIPLDKEFWDRIKAQLEWVDAKVDWSSVFDVAAKGVWPEIGTWKDLKEDEYKRFCRRLSNSLTKIVELSQGADLISDEAIVGGFAFGFNGVQIELPRGPKGEAAEPEEESESAEDTPLDSELDAAAASAAEADVSFGEDGDADTQPAAGS